MTIIAILLKGSLLLAAAIVVHVLVGRRLSATSRHLLWALTIAGLLVLPVLHGSLPAWTVARVTPSRTPAFARKAESAVTRFASEMTSSASAPVGSKDQQLPGLRVSWSTVAGVVYGVGLLAFLLRLVAQRWSIRRLVRRATPVTAPVWTELLDEAARSLNCQRPVVLLRGLEETMPMAFGTRHPAILLPAVAGTWSESQRRAVLLHELAHVARYDCLTQSLAAIVCSLYWLHPGVWWVARRLRIERELACDDRVLGAGQAGDDRTARAIR